MTRAAVARRVVLGVVIIAASAALAPAAAAPGINGADLLILSAPFLFLATVRPRAPKTPAEGAASPTQEPSAGTTDQESE